MARSNTDENTCPEHPPFPTDGLSRRFYLPITLGLSLIIFATLAGCASTQRGGTTSLEQLTQRYRDATSNAERAQLIGPITNAFAALAHSNSTDHRAAQLPARTLAALTADQDRGNGVRLSQSQGIYACNRFLYIHEFNCEVNRPVASGGPNQPTTIREQWVWSEPRSYLFYEGEHVVRFSTVNLLEPPFRKLTEDQDVPNSLLVPRIGEAIEASIVQDVTFDRRERGWDDADISILQRGKELLRWDQRNGPPRRLAGRGEFAKLTVYERIIHGEQTIVILHRRERNTWRDYHVYDSKRDKLYRIPVDRPDDAGWLDLHLGGVDGTGRWLIVRMSDNVSAGDIGFTRFKLIGQLDLATGAWRELWRSERGDKKENHWPHVRDDGRVWTIARNFIMPEGRTLTLHEFGTGKQSQVTVSGLEFALRFRRHNGVNFRVLPDPETGWLVATNNAVSVPLGPTEEFSESVRLLDYSEGRVLIRQHADNGTTEVWLIEQGDAGQRTRTLVHRVEGLRLYSGRLLGEKAFVLQWSDGKSKRVLIGEAGGMHGDVFDRLGWPLRWATFNDHATSAKWYIHNRAAPPNEAFSRDDARHAIVVGATQTLHPIHLPPGVSPDALLKPISPDGRLIASQKTPDGHRRLVVLQVALPQEAN